MENPRVFSILCILILSASCLIGCTPTATQESTVTEPSTIQPTKESVAAPTEEPDLMQELAVGAKKESGLLLTYGMPETWANYGETFAKVKSLYGITQQDIDLGSAVVFSRMTEENASKNDIADLIPTYAMQLADAGLTSDYQVSCWDSIPEGQKGVGKDGSVWTGAYYGTLGWIVNTDIVTDVPKTWADLKDPQYVGMVSYMDPRSTGTGINTVEAIAYALTGDAYDYTPALEYLKELHEMGVIASVDPKVDISKFQIGEIGILINFDYNLLKWSTSLDVPSEVIIPTDGTVRTAYSLIMAKNAPNPNSAKLYLEYQLCGEGQLNYAAAFVTPMNQNVDLPDEIKAQFPPAEMYANVHFIDYVKQEAITEGLTADWAAVVGIQ
jgi:putative spermidine/putrescine transport system substrate-binding protein